MRWLNTDTREGQGGLQGQPMVSEGQHICKGQQSTAGGIRPGLEDKPPCVVKEQDRACHISSPWLCLGSLQYHSRFVQSLLISSQHCSFQTACVACYEDSKGCQLLRV